MFNLSKVVILIFDIMFWKYYVLLYNTGLLPDNPHHADVLVYCNGNDTRKLIDVQYVISSVLKNIC
jgi:hypothetical protein